MRRSSSFANSWWVTIGHERMISVANAVCAALGLTLVEPPGWGCCGSTAAHRADPDRTGGSIPGGSPQPNRPVI